MESYAFEQANETFRYSTYGEYDFHANPYPPDNFMNSYGPSYSCVLLVLYDYCESSDHDAHTCPYRAYVDATCASFEKKINQLTDQMIKTMKKSIAEYSQCVNQSGGNCSESDSSLGSPEPAVSLDDDFEPSYSARPNLNEDMYLPSLDKRVTSLCFYHLTSHPALAHRRTSLMMF